MLIGKTNFVSVKKNSCVLPNPLAVGYALSLCIAGKAKSTYLAGFDGYSKKDQLISKKDLYVENQEILSVYRNKIEITSLTPTLYSDLKKSSIYVQ